MLEVAEYRLLCQAVQEACCLLNNGAPTAGYRCLQAGLDRACDHAADGEPWAEDLIGSYRSALHQYARLRPARKPSVVRLQGGPACRPWRMRATLGRMHAN